MVDRLGLWCIIVGMACVKLKSDGSPCAATPMTGKDYCCFHDPGRRFRKSKRKATKEQQDAWPELEQLQNVANVQALLAFAATELVKLDNTESRARAAAQLATAGLRALEVGQLEKRLEALEDMRGNRDEAA